LILALNDSTAALVLFPLKKGQERYVTIGLARGSLTDWPHEAKGYVARYWVTKMLRR